MPTQEELDRGDFPDHEAAETSEEEAAEEETEESQDGTAEEGDQQDAAAEDTESAAESDDEPAGEDVDPDPEPAQEHMLPKSRYDAVQKRNRALQEKLDRMEAEREQMLISRKENKDRGGDPEKTDDTSDRLSDLDDMINEALLDGDKEAAKRFRAEQRQIEREIFQQEMAESSKTATLRAREQVRTDAAIDFLEATYSELDPNAKEFDQKVVDELETLRSGFVASGDYSPSQALLKAAKYVFPAMPEPPADAAGQPAKPKKDAIKKAVAASKKQPPDISDVGDDSDSAGIKGDIDVMALTEDDFAALPEKTRERLRGDFL